MPQPLRELVGDIFAANGCSAEESARIAKYLVGANLTGHDSHGVIRVPRYVKMKEEGTVVANQTLATVTESDVMAVVDGQFGFGQSMAPAAVQIGIDKAKQKGVAIVALRNSGHLGRAGDWSEMAAEAGQVCVHFVNVAGSLLVAPFGGVDRRLSTAPFSAGVPMPDGPPLILDFATSVVAEGKCLVALNGGKKLPPGALIEPDGRLSEDPRTLYGYNTSGTIPNAKEGAGAIRAFGDHKGSGLAMFCELLAGALTGSGTCGPNTKRLANGMLSIYMQPEVFDSGDFFSNELRSYVEFFKSSRPAEPGGEVLVPGEVERRTRKKREADGIPLTRSVWEGIAETARASGLGDNRIRATLN